MLKLFFFIILGGGLLYRHRSQKLYLKLLMFFLFLTIALRHKTCFLDTYGYTLDYELLANVSFSSIKDNWVKDIFFWYVSKVISILSLNNYTIWFTFLAVCYVYPLYLLLSKYSNNIQISLLIFCCLGFALFSMTGLRQTLAMSCTMFALYFLLNSKYIYFLLLVLIGSLFHMTALVFIILLPLYKLPINNKFMLFYIIIGIFAYILIAQYFPVIMKSEFDSRLEMYIQSESYINYSGFFQQILLFVVSYFYLEGRRNEPIIHTFLWMSFLGVFFQSMTNLLPEMFRVSMYFSISNIFLLSNAFSSNKKAIIAKYSVITALIFYFITSKNQGFLNEYYFFFQNVPSTVYNKLY